MTEIEGDIPNVLRRFFITQKKKGVSKQSQINGMVMVCKLILDQVYEDKK